MEKKKYIQSQIKIHILKPPTILAGSQSLGVSNTETTTQEAKQGDFDFEEE